MVLAIGCWKICKHTKKKENLMFLCLLLLFLLSIIYNLKGSWFPFCTLFFFAVFLYNLFLFLLRLRFMQSFVWHADISENRLPSLAWFVEYMPTCSWQNIICEHTPCLVIFMDHILHGVIIKKIPMKWKPCVQKVYKYDTALPLYCTIL